MGNNRFMDGLLWGMLIGGAGVFLFGTKKGKKLLDIITQEGTDGLNKVLREIETEMEDVGDEAVPEETTASEEIKDLITQKLAKSQSTKSSSKPKVKRFFTSSRKPL
jgi:gas vesicle protein